MAGSFTVDTKELKKLVRALQTTKRSAIPHAVRNSLNTCAFEAKREWATQIDKAMVLRNKWTTGSLRVEKAKGVALATMQSRVGSLVPYLERQEMGGVEQSKGKHGVPIPTPSAAGQGLKARVRAKLVQKKHWLSAIKLHGAAGRSRRQRNTVAVAMAEKSGSGIAFLNLGRRKGLFKVSRTSKGRLRVRMLWDMSKRAVTLKPRPTLEPTLKIIIAKAPEIQKAALLEQLRRAKVGG